MGQAEKLVNCSKERNAKQARDMEGERVLLSVLPLCLAYSLFYSSGQAT